MKQNIKLYYLHNIYLLFRKNVLYNAECCFVIMCALLFLVSCNLKATDKNETLKQEQLPLTLIFAGDVMSHIPQVKHAYVAKTDTYNYNPCFQYIKPFIETADYAFCNLEYPLGGKPYTGYPAFSGPDEILDALQNCGFDVIQTANNHIMDRGNAGNERTINEINKRGLFSVGSYISKEQREKTYPLIIEKSGVRIAVLAYTYGLNNPVAKSDYVNLLDTAIVYNDIQNAKSQLADIIIVLTHWGNEYQLKNNYYQKKWTDFFVNNDVDLVVGSHPHVVQNAEIIQFKDKKIPVFYSLGNMISNQRESNQNVGILAKVQINTKTKKVSNATYVPFYVYRGILNSKYQYYLIPIKQYLNKSLDVSLPKADSLKIYNYDISIDKQLKNIDLYY